MLINDLPWKPKGRILDPFEGAKTWWRGLPTQGIIFCGKPSASIVADAGELPFKNNVFDQIWADPPHLVRNDVKHFNPRYLKFGHYPNRRDLIARWQAWAQEFRRVCSGQLILKTIDGRDSRVTHESDLDLWLPWWEKQETIRVPSQFGWSTTTTLFTLWTARPLFVEHIKR